MKTTPYEIELLTRVKAFLPGEKDKAIVREVLKADNKRFGHEVPETLNAVFGNEGAREFLTWLKSPGTSKPEDKPTEHTDGTDTTADAITAATIWIIGRNKVNTGARVVSRMTSARIEGRNVRMSFESWPLATWPRKHDPAKGKTTDGGCVIAWEEGIRIVGGIFDWHGVEQTVKTLANVPGGYIAGRMPTAGARVWFWIQNYAGTERTSIASGGVWK